MAKDIKNFNATGHKRLGHIGEDPVWKILKTLDWSILPGMMSPCEAYAVGKARLRNCLAKGSRQAYGRWKISNLS